MTDDFWRRLRARYQHTLNLIDQRNASAECMAAFIRSGDFRSAVVAEQEWRRADRELKGLKR